MKKILKSWRDITCDGCWWIDTETKNIYEEKVFDNGGVTTHFFGENEDLPDELMALLEGGE